MKSKSLRSMRAEAYEFVLESPFDSGASWVLVMKGRYVRTNDRHV